jgi:hypothetical protein
MTPGEAVRQAVENHEFRTYRPTVLHSPSEVVGVVAVCWCNAETPPFLSEKAARDAHERHRDRAALMRSFGNWDT